MITRLPNWPERLAAAVESRRTQTFERSKTDCLRTVADIIQEFTGVDLMGQEWRNAYHNDLEAMRLIRRFKGNILEAFKQQVEGHGLVEIDPRSAQRGDLAFVRISETHQGAALFYGGGLISPDKIGFKTLSRAEALHAWRI